ncbi:putative amino acid permease [Leptodontidium sp. 2 PMI_412]|nr:putative amino acid permease [Leptodontidium sp. 2 PMI_412]
MSHPSHHISTDDLALMAQGHKSSLPRQFSAYSTLAFAFSVTNSWIAISATFVFPLVAGGGPTVVYGQLVAAVACCFVTAGLAELASAFPSSGGQYHFAFMVSSVEYRAVTAFVMGWLSVLAWVLASTSSAVFCAQIIAEIGTLYHPTYTTQRWHIYLLFVFVILLCGILIIFLPTLLPAGENIFFLASVLGFVVFTITVLAASKQKQPARVVFKEWENVTGWSDGMAFILGVGSCMYAFLATDAATHIAEELPNPSRNVPRAMILTMVIGILTSVPWTLALLFSSTSLSDVAASTLPVLTAFKQALSSTSGATFLVVWLLFVYFGATISCLATTGRLAWAFARDNGLPFSQYLAKVHPQLKTPANATAACTFVSALYGLVYIASTTAFNSIISLAIISLNITYVIPQGIVLFHGREKVLPAQRWLDLGRRGGRACNAFSVLWVGVYSVVFCLPSRLPVEWESMNYVGAVVVGIGCLIWGVWVGGKKRVFGGPVCFWR